jgi:hypothetical protein
MPLSPLRMWSLSAPVSGGQNKQGISKRKTGVFPVFPLNHLIERDGSFLYCE